jgi:hypothetical protein
MNITEFKIGQHFLMGQALWRCTDKGTRTIAAIRLGDVVTSEDGLKSDAPEIHRKATADGWTNGPTYALAEYVIDEDDMPVCVPVSIETGEVSKEHVENAGWDMSRFSRRS